MSTRLNTLATTNRRVSRDLRRLEAGLNAVEASGGGGANGTTATLDFGTNGTTASTTLTGLAWVAAGTKFTASLAGSTADHTAEEAALQGITLSVGNVVAGVGFTVYGFCPTGAVGTVSVHIAGV